MIPARVFRTVPAGPDSPLAARCWASVARALPGWEHVTYRDPLDPADFPISSPYWARCTSGAQKAGLIRLESLLTAGGIYLDSDVELFGPLDSLRHCAAFAAYEDPGVIPDAVIGAVPRHPAIREALDLALARITEHSGHWQTDGAWGTGPGVTTAVFAGRPDVLLLGPDSFYPVHYTVKAEIAALTPRPWTFGVHHYANSWQGGA